MKISCSVIRSSICIHFKHKATTAALSLWSYKCGIGVTTTSMRTFSSGNLIFLLECLLLPMYVPRNATFRPWQPFLSNIRENQIGSHGLARPEFQKWMNGKVVLWGWHVFLFWGADVCCMDLWLYLLTPHLIWPPPPHPPSLSISRCWPFMHWIRKLKFCFAQLPFEISGDLKGCCVVPLENVLILIIRNWEYFYR